MKPYHHLLLTITPSGVATVTLNRPEIHNAFNDALVEELSTAFTMLAARPDVRLAVLRGAGKSFCAGADLAVMKAAKEAGEEENREQAKKLAWMFETLNRFPKPLIGVIHGAALGGGAGLAAVCDFVLAGPEARFGLPEVRLGILPAVIAPYVIAKIGHSNARACFLSGMQFDVAGGMRMGMVHRYVSKPEELEAALEQIISKFLLGGPQAQTMAKEVIFGIEGKRGREVIDYTSGLIARARAGEEGQEGLAAFLEKRAPKWAEEK